MAIEKIPTYVPEPTARGSIITSDPTPAWQELTIGGAGKVPTSDGTDVSWQYVTSLHGPSLTIGDGSGDIALTFDGAAADGLLTWKDDEDRFEFDDQVYFNAGGVVLGNGLSYGTDVKCMFRSATQYIHSPATGKLKLRAPTEILLSGPVQFDSAIIDANGNEVLELGSVSSATGNLKITNTNGTTDPEIVLEHVGDESYGKITIQTKDHASSAIKLDNSDAKSYIQLGGMGGVAAVTYSSGDGEVGGIITLQSVNGNIILNANEIHTYGDLIQHEGYGDLVAKSTDSGSVVKLEPQEITALEALGVTSGVNHVRVRAAVTTASPSVEAYGSDPDVNLTIKSKGAGNIVLDDAVDAQGHITLTAEKKVYFRDTDQFIYSVASEKLHIEAKDQLDFAIDGVGYAALTKTVFDVVGKVRGSNLVADGAVTTVAGCLSLGNEIITGTETQAAMYHKPPTGYSNQNHWLKINVDGVDYMAFLYTET
jgi:hypothetical protein